MSAARGVVLRLTAWRRVMAGALDPDDGSRPFDEVEQVVLVNLDHVQTLWPMEPPARGSHVWLAGAPTPLTVRESVDALEAQLTRAGVRCVMGRHQAREPVMA